jgi:hypothetical protein
MAATAELNLTLDPMGNSHKNLLVEGPPQTILEEDNPMTILSQFGSN